MSYAHVEEVHLGHSQIILVMVDPIKIPIPKAGLQICFHKYSINVILPSQFPSMFCPAVLI